MFCGACLMNMTEGLMVVLWEVSHAALSVAGPPEVPLR